MTASQKIEFDLRSQSMSKKITLAFPSIRVASANLEPGS